MCSSYSALRTHDFEIIISFSETDPSSGQIAMTGHQTDLKNSCVPQNIPQIFRQQPEKWAFWKRRFLRIFPTHFQIPHKAPFKPDKLSLDITIWWQSSKENEVKWSRFSSVSLIRIFRQNMKKGTMFEQTHAAEDSHMHDCFFLKVNCNDITAKGSLNKKHIKNRKYVFPLNFREFANSDSYCISRWWFQRFFIFTPILVEMIQFDEHIFQMGGSTTN